MWKQMYNIIINELYEREGSLDAQRQDRVIEKEAREITNELCHVAIDLISEKWRTE